MSKNISRVDFYDYKWEERDTLKGKYRTKSYKDGAKYVEGDTPVTDNFVKEVTVVKLDNDVVEAIRKRAEEETISELSYLDDFTFERKVREYTHAAQREALRKAKQLSKRYNNSVNASTEEVNTPSISEVTSADLGAKKSYSFEELETLVDNSEDLIDRRNQQFKLEEERLDVEGEEIRNLKFQYARSFKSFYWISSGRISIGEERPQLEAGQFSLFNKGIMNSKKMDTLSFAVARYLGCKQEDLAPVWFENKPHFYEESTRRLVEINVVDGKAFGYKDGIKKI